MRDCSKNRKIKPADRVGRAGSGDIIGVLARAGRGLRLTLKKVFGFCAICFLPLALMFLSQLSHAEQSILKPFPLSKVVESKTADLPEYRLVTGRMSSIGAVGRPEKQEIISGQVNKVTYEVPKVHTPEEVMEYYRGLLSSLKGRIIFSCDSRNCGPSNDWANEVFKERILYGHDRYQHYTVASITKESVSYMAVIYTIRRGNQRVYAHLETIKLAEPFFDDEVSDPFIQIANNELSETRAMENKLTPWLEKVKLEFDKPRIVIVSYSRQADVSAVKNLENAREQGRMMQLSLARQAFFAENQIDVISVGPFAPRSLFDEHQGFVRMFAIESE